MDVVRKLAEVLEHGYVQQTGLSPLEHLDLENIVYAGMSGSRMPDIHKGVVFHAFDKNDVKGSVTGRIVPDTRIQDWNISPLAGVDALRKINHPYRMLMYTPRHILHEGQGYWWFPGEHTPNHIPLSRISYVASDDVLEFIGAGAEFLHLLHQENLLNSDSAISNFIAEIYAADGKQLLPQHLSHLGANEILSLCKQRGSLRLQNVKATDTELVMFQKGRIERYHGGDVAGSLRGKSLPAIPSSDFYLFLGGGVSLQNRSDNPTRKEFRQVHSLRKKYESNPEDPQKITYEEVRFIAQTPEREATKWHVRTRILASALCALSLFSGRAYRETEIEHGLETTLVQEALQDSVVTQEELLGIGTALARKVERQLSSGEYPLSSRSFRRALKQYVSAKTSADSAALPKVTIPRVPVIFPSDGSQAETWSILTEGGGGLTMKLYAAAKLLPESEKLHEAARASAYAQALGVFISPPSETSVATENMFLFPLLEAYQDTKDPLLLRALVRSGEYALREIRECPEGPLLPYKRMSLDPALLRCRLFSDEIIAIENLLSASTAASLLKEEDVFYEPTKRLVDALYAKTAQYVPGIISFEGTPSSPDVLFLGQAYAARIFAEAGEKYDENKYSQRALELMTPFSLAVSGFSSNTQGVTNTFATAVSLNTKNFFTTFFNTALPLELLNYVPQAEVTGFFPRIYYDSNELLSGVCTAFNDTKHCNVGHVMADGFFLNWIAQKKMEK